jgi:hypothetical protein
MYFGFAPVPDEPWLNIIVGNGPGPLGLTITISSEIFFPFSTKSVGTLSFTNSAALIKESEKIIKKYEDIWSIVELSFEFMG